MMLNVFGKWDDMSRDERFGACVAMTADGKSAREIAAILGTTRNAVCGFRWREQIEPDAVNLRKLRARSTVAMNAANAARGKPPKPKPVKVAEPKTEAPPVVVIEPEPIAVIEPEPEPVVAHGPVSLFDAAPDQCRFPLFDDPRGIRPADMLVCGDPVRIGSNYCADHHSRCWTPVDKTRRRAERLAFRW
jgi:hypothetical protein